MSRSNRYVFCNTNSTLWKVSQLNIAILWIHFVMSCVNLFLRSDGSNLIRTLENFNFWSTHGVNRFFRLKRNFLRHFTGHRFSAKGDSLDQYRDGEVAKMKKKSVHGPSKGRFTEEHWWERLVKVKLSWLKVFNFNPR